MMTEKKKKTLLSVLVALVAVLSVAFVCCAVFAAENNAGAENVSGAEAVAYSADMSADIFSGATTIAAVNIGDIFTVENIGYFLIGGAVLIAIVLTASLVSFYKKPKASEGTDIGANISKEQTDKVEKSDDIIAKQEDNSDTNDIVVAEHTDDALSVRNVADAESECTVSTEVSDNSEAAADNVADENIDTTTDICDSSQETMPETSEIVEDGSEDIDADEEDDDLSDLSNDESEESDSEVSYTMIGDRKIYYRYNYSFKAKLIQSSPEIQEYYGNIIDDVTACAKAKYNMSWRQVRIYSGRQTLALVIFRGRKLAIAYALNPEDYEETKYHGIDVSDIKRFEKTPMLLRITSERKAGYARYLLNETFSKFGLDKGETIHSDFSLPYQSTEQLIEEKLVKVLSNADIMKGAQIEKADIAELIREKITLREAQTAITNEVAATLIESEPVETVRSQEETVIRQSESGSAKGIINIDILSNSFDAGDTVTLAKMKEKGLLGKKVGYVKVLARGSLNKPLTVIADDYSLDAVKMIALTGGKAIRQSK